MAILKSCCWKSVRSGSFACAVYTLIFYSVVLTAGVFHVKAVSHLPVFLALSILMVILAACSVVSSVVLIIGLCTDNRLLLLPWIISLSLTTMLDVVLSFYLVIDATFDPFFGVFFVTDIFICALNVYCLLCVLSQYQDYQARLRGGSTTPDQPHQLHRSNPSGRQCGHKTAPQITTTTISDDGTSTSSYLIPPSQRKMSLTPKSMLYSELSTISEEQSIHEPARKMSDSSTLTTDTTLFGDTPIMERKMSQPAMTLVNKIERHYSFSSSSAVSPRVQDAGSILVRNGSLKAQRKFTLDECKVEMEVCLNGICSQASAL